MDNKFSKSWIKMRMDYDNISRSSVLVDYLNLIPKESSPFSKVELFINKHKMQISSFNMIDKQGSNYKYTIDSFETNIEFNNDFFIFAINKVIIC